MKAVHLVFALTLVAAIGACQSSGAEQASSEIAPLPLAGTECKACGMTVDEQPAPRGQIVHRDGTHAYFCSLADMVDYLGAPSPHGAALATFVELLPVGIDPAETDLAQHTWAKAAEAVFVIGEFERAVMGRPILSFASESDAREATERLDGEIIPWDALPAHIH